MPLRNDIRLYLYISFIVWELFYFYWKTQFALRGPRNNMTALFSGAYLRHSTSLI